MEKLLLGQKNQEIRLFHYANLLPESKNKRYNKEAQKTTAKQNLKTIAIIEKN